MPLTYKSNWGGKNFTPLPGHTSPQTCKITHTPPPLNPSWSHSHPHHPTTSPQSCNLPTHMLAPTQICSHMACFTHTNVHAQAEPHMPSDFISRSVCSLQLRLAAITAQQGSAPIPDQPLPEVTSRAPSINRGRMAPPQHIHQPLA